MTLKNSPIAVCVGLGLLSSLFFATGCEPRVATVTMKAVSTGNEEAKTDAAAPAAEAGWGNLTGTVTLSGAAPTFPPVINQGDATVKDSSVCAAATVPNETLVVNPANQGIENIVIFLDKPPVVKPELKEVPKTPLIFDQKGCRFFPHLLLVRVGQEVLVKSDDAVLHNTHTNPTRNTSFNSAIAPKDRDGKPLKYTKPEAQPITVVCDLHPWMQALHFPIDHPYAAVTDKDGKFKIEGLPAGKHVFKVWHEKGKYLDRKLEVTIEAGKDASVEPKYAPAQFN